MIHDTCNVCVPVCEGGPVLEVEVGYRAVVGGGVWVDGGGEGGV